VRVPARAPSSLADAPAVSHSAAQSELTRAIDLVGRGRTTEATQVLLAALNRRPDWVDARSMLAALQAEAGDRREALSTLLAGVATDPARFAPTAAQLQAELEDPAGALQTLDRVPAAARDRPYHALAAAIAQHAGQHELAVAEYAAALRFDPADSVAWVGLGISLQALGRGEQALAAFRGAAQGTLSADLRRFVQARIRELQSAPSEAQSAKEGRLSPLGASAGLPPATRP
jgi:MSHA biogenesis protein MshN